MSRRQQALLTLDMGDDGLIVTEWHLDTTADEQSHPAASATLGEADEHCAPQPRAH